MSQYACFFLVPILLYLGNPTLDAQSISTWKAQLSNSDQELRINALLELNKAYNQTQLDSAALYGQTALQDALQLGKDSLVGVAHSQLCLTYYYQRQLDSMLHHAQAGKAAALNAGAEMLRAYCLKMEALSYSYLEDFEAAKRCNESALSIYQEQQDTARMAGIYSNQGRLYQRQAVYNEALAEFVKAQNLFALQNDVDGESITAAQIGDLLLDMERPSEAVSYLHRSLALTDTVQSPIRHGDLLIALGSAYSADSMDLDSAYLYFEASRVRFAQINDLQGLAIAHNNLGNVLLQQNRHELAYSHLHQSRAIATANNWPPQIAFNAKNLGLYHQKNEQQDSAIHYFLQAYNLSQEHEMAFAEEAILLSLYQHYKQTGQAAQALAIYEQYQSLLEATKNESVQKEIAALQTAYETEQKEQQIARLELEGALQQSRSRTYVLGFTALSSALLLIVGLLYYRRRKDREMFELRQTVLKQDKEKLDQELQYKTKQLTSHALHMVQKNKVLQELRMGISDLVKGADATQKKALRSLVRRIDFNIQADEDWQTFRLYFEQTNQNFYKKLAEINSDLTTTDLKLCSLIKLNLNIKETAAVLNIEPTSVKTARHRLRKKLRLEPGQDLTSFIRQVA